MTLEDFFAVKHKGRIVACANLIPLEWCLSGIPLKVAELGCVATLPEYRRRGLQRRLMEEYHKRVLKKGYDLSAIEESLFTIANSDTNTRYRLTKKPDSPSARSQITRLIM